MISLQSITLQLGTKLLFDDASLSIFAKQKAGIIGLNGSGKSTLFSLLRQKIEPSGGKMFIPPQTRIAYLAQDVPHGTISALQYVINGDIELTNLLKKLQLAEATQNSNQIAELHGRLYEIDGYAANARAAKILNGLGFSDREQTKSVNEFSGGWRMRLNLAQVLMCPGEMMLLDEPTNYLDLDTIVWLENWLQNYDGTLLIISHDREFLDNVVNKIVHVNNCKLDLYTGNYSDFERERAMKLANEKAAFTKQQGKIAHLSKFVERFRAKASKAKQAQSRIKMLEKMELVALTHVDSPFSFEFQNGKPISTTLLRFDHIDFSYPDKQIFKDVSFIVEPNDRIGILGINGAGKSTFMKLLSQQINPDGGDFALNKATKIGYFAQHQVDQLNLSESPYYHILQISPKATEQEVRSFLGSFAFRDATVFNPIENFSGGEKARLVLAILVWQKPNLLLLDEPTNHLDLDMREALTYALQNYEGAIVLVSHDRYLLKATVDDFFLVSNSNVAKFSGDLDEYQSWLLQERKLNKASQLLSSQNTSQPDSPIDKEKKKQMQKLEARLNKLQLELETYESSLLDVSIYLPENQALLREKLEKIQSIKEKILTAESEWLELV